jgi:hypothetical protein
MAVTHDQHAPIGANTGGGNQTVTFSNQPQAGSTVLVACWFSTNGTSDPTVADNAAGNTYSKVVGNNPGSGTLSCYIFKADSINLPGSTLQVTVSSSHFQVVAFADSYLGMATGTADATNTANVGSGVSTAGVSVTPTVTNDLIFVAMTVDTGSTASGIGLSPGTLRDAENNDTTALTGGGGDNGTGGGLGTGSQTETFTWTGTSTTTARLAIAAFQQAGVAAPGAAPAVTSTYGYT